MKSTSNRLFSIQSITQGSFKTSQPSEVVIELNSVLKQDNESSKTFYVHCVLLNLVQNQFS
jgi:hypothetical protein